MSDRPVGDDIDQLLRGAMEDLSDHAPVLPEPDELTAPVLILDRDEEEHPVMKQRTWITIATVAAAVLLVAGIVVFAGNGDDGEQNIADLPTPVPTSGADVSVPDPDAPTAGELAATAMALIESEPELALLLAAEADALGSQVATQAALFETLVATGGIVQTSIPLDHASAATVSPNGELAVTMAPVQVWDLTGPTAVEVALPEGIGGFEGWVLGDDEIYIRQSESFGNAYSYPGFELLDEIARIDGDILPNGDLVIGGPATVTRVDPDSRQVLASADSIGSDREGGGWPAWVSASHDGSLVAQRNVLGEVLIHQGETLEEIVDHPLSTNQNEANFAAVRWVDFSPAGPVVLITSVEGQSVLVDASSGAVVSELATRGAGSEGVQWAEFSNDGTHLVTPYDDGVQIWNTEVGALIADVELERGGHSGAGGAGTDLWFDFARPSTGARLMTVSIAREAGFEVWTIDPAEWPQRACDTAARQLTDAERASYGLEATPSAC